MEGIRIPKIKHGEEKREKNPFEVLTAELVGKTRDELTPEQREAEDSYCDRAFRNLMQLINDDKVLMHTSPALESILKLGILSLSQMWHRGMYASSDEKWQAGGDKLLRRIIPEFLAEYVRYKQGEISDENFSKYREGIVDEFPKLGQTRARHYFENIIPKSFDKGWFEMNEKDWNYFGYDSEMEQIIKSFSGIKKSMRRLKKQELLGHDIISTSNSKRLKKKFIEFEDYNYIPVAGLNEGRGDTFFFDRPTEDRLIALDYDARKSVGEYYVPEKSEEENIHDLGVASRVRSKNFQAISLGSMLYNQSQRVIYLLQNYEMGDKNGEMSWKYQYVPDEMIELLKEQQAGQLMLFDHMLQPLPPLESVNIVNVPYSTFQVFHLSDYEGELGQLRDLSEENNKQTKEKIKALIKENHWDWYEKYGKKDE